MEDGSPWTHKFTAGQGETIASATIGGVSQTVQEGASSWTASIPAVSVDVAVRIEYAAAEEGFKMENLRWTGFNPKTGVTTFTATAEGDAPATITLVYRATLGGSDQKAEACEWSLDAEKGEGTVTVPANLRSLPTAFFIGLETAE